MDGYVKVSCSDLKRIQEIAAELALISQRFMPDRSFDHRLSLVREDDLTGLVENSTPTPGMLPDEGD
jgi:uncharacterized protein involved in propanediol utilization